MTGTVVCSQPSYVWVSGSLRQNRGGQALEGWFSGLFRGRSALLYTAGPAEAGVTASGSGWATGEWDSESIVAPVRLSGAK